MLLAQAGQFFASDSTYKDIYGDGPVFGGEVRVPIGPGGRRLIVFADGSYRTRKGELSYTNESTTVAVTVFEGGPALPSQPWQGLAVSRRRRRILHAE